VPARGVTGSPELAGSLKQAVAAALGASFRPKAIAFVTDVPKTRSMKIMRRVVRAVWLGKPVGDLSGLVNPEAVDELKAAVVARET
jgi:acetyl-CoA synthetase